MLFFWAVQRLNNELVSGLTLLGMGIPLLIVGLSWRIIPHIIVSILVLALGLYQLYRGIPIELRERRRREIRQRWENLDEEKESETST